MNISLIKIYYIIIFIMIIKNQIYLINIVIYIFDNHILKTMNDDHTYNHVYNIMTIYIELFNILLLFIIIICLFCLICLFC